jgi:hypothetical protein
VTTFYFLAFIASVLVVGSAIGLALFVLLAEQVHRRGVLDGQRQAERAHGYPASAPLPRRWLLVDRKPPPADPLVLRVMPQAAPRVLDHMP